MPGVTYERQVQFTPHGPVAIHVLTAPRPAALYALKPVLSNESILGRETRDRDAAAPLARLRRSAGVNGDLFDVDGRPAERRS